MSVDLGFAEKCESWRLESRFFPSKVGGKPAWLDLKNLPSSKDLECDYCGEPCIFLCQVYAPYEECETAFHRTIYVFVCKKSECCRLNENGNLKVFRSQLERVNEFFPSDPPTEEIGWRTDICTDKWVKTCSICGILAPNHCSKCKSTNYCCRAHQVYDWKHGHKESCGSSVSNKPQFVFPEYELVIESEGTVKEDDEEEDAPEKEEEEIQKYEEMRESGKAGTFQNEDVNKDLLNMANNTEDETFSEFRLTIDKFPDQVLRYDRGGEVLYISSENKLKEIPKCPQCDSERQFEFQIMPQLLNFLELENALKCIDWGILVIFTCAKSCVPKSGYCLEYVWKQDIVEENLDDAKEEDNVNTK